MNLLRFNLLLISLLLANLFFNCIYSYSDEIKQYYPLEKGNIWIYQIKEEAGLAIQKLKIGGTENIDNVETIKLIYDNGNYDCIGKDSEGIKLYKTVSREDPIYDIYTPARIILPFDISSPKEYKYSESTYDGAGNLLKNLCGEGTVEIKFEARKDIIVPAGRFLNCIKVLKISSWMYADGSFAQDAKVIWFAKGIGIVKEIEEEIGYSVKEGTTYTDIEEYELKSAIINGIKYGEKN